MGSCSDKSPFLRDIDDDDNASPPDDDFDDQGENNDQKKESSSFSLLLLDDDPDETDETRKLHAEMMEIYASSIEGLHLHEAVPGWLLTCRLPWALDRASASLAGTSQGSLKHNGGAPHTLPDPQPYLCPWS